MRSKHGLIQKSLEMAHRPKAKFNGGFMRKGYMERFYKTIMLKKEKKIVKTSYYQNVKDNMEGLNEVLARTATSRKHN